MSFACFVVSSVEVSVVCLTMSLSVFPSLYLEGVRLVCFPGCRLFVLSLVAVFVFLVSSSLVSALVIPLVRCSRVVALAWARVAHDVTSALGAYSLHYPSSLLKADYVSDQRCLGRRLECCGYRCCGGGAASLRGRCWPFDWRGRVPPCFW